MWKGSASDIIKSLADEEQSRGQVPQLSGNPKISDLWGYPFIVTKLSVKTAKKIWAKNTNDFDKLASNKRF